LRSIEQALETSPEADGVIFCQLKSNEDLQEFE
jgi:hypothetical protein